MTTASNSRVLRTIPLLIAICLVSLPAHAQYGGGTGEPNDPYQIATAEDLMKLGETPEDYDKHFILTADIDLDPNLPGRKVFDRAVIAPDTNDATWQFEGTPFTGVVDGNDHTIVHLTISGAGTLGLFGQLSGEVKNLGLVEVDITGTEYFFASLVGVNRGNVSHCYSTGAVSGGSNIGGLVGSNYSVVTHCHSTVAVSGHHAVSGLVGVNNGSVSASYSTGSISGIKVGGLVGLNYGSIEASYSSSPVTGRLAGGLVGENFGYIETSYSTGTVSGGTSQFSSTAGLVAQNHMGSIFRCYSISPVSPKSAMSVGGLLGSPLFQIGTVTVTDCFWDTETSGQTMSHGGTGKTTAEMQMASTFLEAGWDFVDETENGSYDIWKISEGLDYPRLWWEKYGGGTGEPNYAYLIYTAEHLNALGGEPNDYDKHFKLMADIDLSGYSYDSAVIAPDVNDAESDFQGTAFIGVFDGNGHAIKNLVVSGDGHLGFFGCLGKGGEIVNLGLLDVDVTGSGYRIGGLAGENDGSISNCHSTGLVAGGHEVGGLIGNSCGSVWNCRSAGEVTGVRMIGGLVGWNRGLNCEGIVSGCSSTATASGWGWYVGGLVGITSGHLVDCYSTGDVVGDFRVGGLAGYHAISSGYASILNSYSTGEVKGNNSVGGLVGESWNLVGNSFWDIETSGQIASDGGTGKTTAEMQTASTFLEAGWDFTDETANGMEDIWWILEGQDYPRLWWELIPKH